MMNGQTGQGCLVIGAGGFLGQHLCRMLRHDAALIPTSSDAALAARQGWLHLDVTAPDTLHALPPRVHSVVYLAQSPHYKNFPARAAHIWEVNVQGVLRLLEYAREAGARHFVLASSGSVYAPSVQDMREDAPLVQGVEGNFYIRSKIASELLLNAYSTFFSTACLRFFTLYGPGLGKNMLMTRMVHAVQEGLPIQLGGDDGLIFNPVYVEDAVRAVVSALSLKGNHTVNVAGPEVVTLGQVCRAIGEAVGREPNVVREGTGQRMVADISAMRALLCTSDVELRTGLGPLVRSCA